MVTSKEIKQELLSYLEILPMYLWVEVLNFVKYLLFKEQQLAPKKEEGLTTTPLKETVESNPLWQMVGMFDSGLGDLAVNHDKYLAKIELEANLG